MVDVKNKQPGHKIGVNNQLFLNLFFEGAKKAL